MRLAYVGAVVSLSSATLVFCVGACSSPYFALPHVGDAGVDAGAGDSPVGADGDMDGRNRHEDAGVPSLTELSVSVESKSLPATLTPPFSPTIHDYYVRCHGGDNTLTVSMTASPGDTSWLIQPTVTSATRKQTLTVHARPNQAIVAAASSATATVEYWVRCLPPDFPQFQWTAHPANGSPSPGYYLLGVARRPANVTGTYAFMVDTNGVPVWYTKPDAPEGVFDVDDVVPGALSYLPLPGDSFDVQALHPPSTTRVTASSATIDEHELRHEANGHFVSISSPIVTADLTGMKVLFSDGGAETLSGPENIIACNILEFAPDGTVVWNWTGTDHFDPVVDAPSAWLEGSYYSVFHCNSIDVDPKNGNLLVSAREMSTVFYIERTTMRVLWKMGGASASLDDAAYVSVADPFAYQHDARLIDWTQTCAGGKGQVSMFDDETDGTRPARGVVYDVTVGAPDGGASGCDGGTPSEAGAGQATVAWEYLGPSPSQAMGSFRISPDGSRVIGWGEGGALTGFREVDAAKKTLVDFVFTDGNASYRTVKVPLTAFDLEVLRTTAGLP